VADSGVAGKVVAARAVAVAATVDVADVGVATAERAEGTNSRAVEIPATGIPSSAGVRKAGGTAPRRTTELRVGSMTWRLRLQVPHRVWSRDGTTQDRDDWFASLWSLWGGSEAGLVGIHEGTLLTEQAFEMGLETESWTVDAGEAPRDRDWLAASAQSESTLFFGTEAAARQALVHLQTRHVLEILECVEQPDEDWDAQWKASFRGVDVHPFWRIRPPWVSVDSGGSGIPLLLNPGAGFGTGTHETTQLCLKLLADFAPRVSGRSEPMEALAGCRVLDFGSGSGVLSIAAARLGARETVGIEIDPLAIDNAQENARLNGVEGRIRFVHEFADFPEVQGGCELVLANILRPVLVQFSREIVGALRERGARALILSGLIAADVEPILATFGRERGLGEPAHVLALGDWRGIGWLIAD
jgi:ribosomal protein L11 methyltransferase